MESMMHIGTLINLYGTREDKPSLPHGHQALGFLCADAIPHAAQSAEG